MHFAHVCVALFLFSFFRCAQSPMLFLLFLYYKKKKTTTSSSSLLSYNMAIDTNTHTDTHQSLQFIYYFAQNCIEPSLSCLLFCFFFFFATFSFFYFTKNDFLCVYSTFYISTLIQLLLTCKGRNRV